MNDDSEEMSGDNSLTNPIEPEVSQTITPQSENLPKAKETKPVSAQFAQWQALFDAEESPEKKIRMAIDFMRVSLSQGETPRFKDFWECRRLCLLLFKENIPAKVRSPLWSEYVEISNEARRLKDILDEQSAFAVEQIELAIQSIESDLEHFAVLLTHAQDIPFPESIVSLKEKQNTYNSMQKELQLLNTLAMRINALRKEIIKTEMRIRIKNKLLERLSVCGDRVFPQRKELISSLSNEFTNDVEHFVSSYFHSGEVKELPLHVLREEIKFLQMFAKVLTLNTQAFSTTRLKLSECWDLIKSQEKERKKEILQKKQAHRQNYDQVIEKINSFAVECQGEISLTDCTARAQEIAEFMKGVELGRDEVRVLKDELFKAKKMVLDRERDKEQQRTAKEKDIEVKRREKINALREELSSLVQNLEHLNIDELAAKREELVREFDSLHLNKIEKQIVDRLFKQLKDAVAEKKEKAILSLSEDDLKSLEQLRELLKERMERRAEIKDQLEHFRKALGGSGFDFEKAIMYRELIESEKASLEKIDAAIEELEQKIEDIEG